MSEGEANNVIYQERYLHSRCHPEDPTWVCLAGNTATVTCSVCDQAIAVLEVILQRGAPGDSRLYYDKATKTIKCDKEPGLSITPENDEPCM